MHVGDAPCHADCRAFRELVSTAPQTFAGLQAWASYLDEVGQCESWMFQEKGPTLVATLAEALGNLAVAS